jgi:hypothetical protein
VSGTSAHATFTLYIVDTGIPYLPSALQIVPFGKAVGFEDDEFICSAVHSITFDPVKRKAYYGYTRFLRKRG